MKKKIWIPIIIMLVIIGFFLIIYSTVEIQTDNKLIAFRYTDDTAEFETEFSFNETYVYYADRDITITNFNFKKFLFFHVITMEYTEGNYCDTQFVLEEEYISDFLERAVIEENVNHLDIAKLIEGKQAIIGNTRYLGNDYENAIFYVLDGKYEEMYVFYVDDLLVIQVGSPDECPKYIAYAKKTGNGEEKNVLSEPTENQFDAKVLEIYDGYIMVDAVEGQDIVGEVRVQLGLLEEKEIPNLEKNDIVRITHDGKMTMSLPPQMTAVEILKNNP